MRPPLINIKHDSDIKRTIQNNDSSTYIPDVHINRNNNDNLSDNDLGVDYLANASKIKKIDELNSMTGNIQPKFPVQQPPNFANLDHFGIDNNQSPEHNLPSNIAYTSGKTNDYSHVSDVDSDHSHHSNDSDYNDVRSQHSEHSEHSHHSSRDDKSYDYDDSYRSPQEVLKEKRKLLFKLRRYEKKGYRLSREYTITNTLDDLQTEVDTIRREINLDSSVKVSKNILISVCSIVEFLNNKFDPFDVVLDGWSEEINEDVENHEYDEIFEELYDKYHEQVAVGPELKLLMMIGGSAVKFHLTHTILKSVVPGAETLLKQHPDLRDQIQSLVMKNVPGLSGNVASVANILNSQQKSSQQNRMNRNNEMNAPTGVDDILQELQQGVDDNMSSDSDYSVKKDKKGKTVVNVDMFS